MADGEKIVERVTVRVLQRPTENGEWVDTSGLYWPTQLSQCQDDLERLRGIFGKTEVRRVKRVTVVTETVEDDGS